MDKEVEKEINEVLVYFDRWTKSIGLPNDVKPLQNITSQEYLKSLQNFYNSLDTNISFRKWIESFYSKNEIDFDYIDLMDWKNWLKLYLSVFSRYVEKILVD